MRLAFKVAAPLVECEEKIAMSIPAAPITFLANGQSWLLRLGCVASGLG